MIKPHPVAQNPRFIGRHDETACLQKIDRTGEASIIVVHGRRRVGKTELIEQVFRDRNLLKFEGIQNLPEKKQIEHCTEELCRYVNDDLIKKLSIKNWKDFFEILARYVAEQKCTLYFEEIQWLADYRDDLIASLKYVWDNKFRHNKHLIIVLCGSSPSFVINHILKSKALYNRSQHEIPLKEFSLKETGEFLKKRSLREILDAYLLVGGIPEYLKWINRDSSVFLSLCKNSFVPGSFFSREFEKIFTSSLSERKGYKKIVEFLSKRRFATRNEIIKHIKSNSGGTPSELMADLELCGFVEKYTPYNLNDNSLLARYCIKDAYLQFYFKFIKQLGQNIENGDYTKDPTRAIDSDSLVKWQGFSFERFCRKNHRIIARILGFEAVRYRVGTFFNREIQSNNPGYQIDLVFERDDRVVTLCEIKYLTGKVTKEAIIAFERKISLFPRAPNKTINKVLIAPAGADKAVVDSGFFDRIIGIDDFF
ncbi:MAG: AAA family ATPase [Deltaproteobacteria bacterium]|nr:AAA family ATPase [Deltaproteobacteria bacterium]